MNHSSERLALAMVAGLALGSELSGWQYVAAVVLVASPAARSTTREWLNRRWNDPWLVRVTRRKPKTDD